MEEKKFLEERGVIVTNARFMAQGQTYAMSGITSVKSFEQRPSRTGPIIGVIVGLLGLMSGGRGGIAFGLIVLAGSILYWWGQKAEFSVRLATASGEVKALTSDNGAFIAKVVGALNDSIVHRG